MFKRGWVKLRSSWDGGGVYRSGPALNIYDEDTLLGLMVLRSRRLVGPADHMPTAVRRLDTEDTTPTDEHVQVDCVVFTTSQLETAIRGYTPRSGWGGRELARRRESIEDLYGLQLRFDKVYDGSRYQAVNDYAARGVYHLVSYRRNGALHAVHSAHCVSRKIVMAAVDAHPHPAGRCVIAPTPKRTHVAGAPVPPRPAR
ncbi:hypothetical protein [uncultured Thiodictyon sp.]|jgi:hypothetical protein|uniref:hypothetical protein n=1 Tax=uncultured Thiodictyon sp. TaxID=1846217 RepID=UPI0025D5F1E3|nr:hypothetical protein [uncultured Thiodictyon sp.]